MLSDVRVSDILIRVYAPDCRPNLPFNFFVIVVLICYCHHRTCALCGLSDDLFIPFVLYCASSDVRWHGQTYLFITYPDRASCHLPLDFLCLI